MNILVTGGAGYIGSATVEALRARGDQVAVVDNLSTGHREALFDDVPFHNLDLHDIRGLAEVMEGREIEAVVHFAAFSLVGESVQNPEKYMHNNVGGTIALLSAMRAANVQRIVFSSTAATYGEPEAVPITEDQRTAPTNPYGLTKRFMEQVMETYEEPFGLRSVCLRYFNAAGATPNRGEDHRPESHLIPLVLQVALGQRESIAIFGTDYDTPDGTCIRDYIHVEDLADAHLRALDYLAKGGASLKCNLGNGDGHSVREVIDICREVTGHAIPAIESPRRAGDPSKLVASAGRAREILGWNPKKGDLKTIVTDAWNWHSNHPDGYGG
ncbi:UDP-glucose 4-epimerase GalE [bacterium]|nr:UDP-glucose 4-epimerase GalE [bacterium]